MTWLRTEYERAYRLIRLTAFWQGQIRDARSPHERDLARVGLAQAEAELREVDNAGYYPAHRSYALLVASMLKTNCLGARQLHSENEASAMMRMLPDGWLRWRGGKNG